MIHFKYDDAATLFFKVFNEEGERLECCPEGDSSRDSATGAGYAAPPLALRPAAVMTLGNPATLLSPVILQSRVTTATCRQAPAKVEVQQRLPPDVASDALGLSSCLPSFAFPARNKDQPPWGL